MTIDGNKEKGAGRASEWLGQELQSGGVFYMIEKRMTIDIGCRTLQTLNK